MNLALSLSLNLIAVTLFTGILAIGADGFAARDDMDVESAEEISVRKVARGRLYPGGVDAEPLKVQEQLPTIKKQGDNEAEPPESADAD